MSPDDGESDTNPHPAIEPGQVAIVQNREYSTTERSYLIAAHKPTYFLATYNSEFDPTANGSFVSPGAADAEKEEAKFQISMKFPLWQNAFGPATDLYFGYTQVAYWQLFTESEALSRPFREINYEPELFFRHYGGPRLPWGGVIDGIDLGVVHQSNGQTLEFSRSWNRLMGRAAATFDELAFLGRLWYRIPESADEDGNPYEYRYLGYGDLRTVWSPGNHIVTAMLRPATESVSYELTWSYPLGDELRLYAQWFNGYGENLYEYDRRSNRIGIGIAITDWLIGEQ